MKKIINRRNGRPIQSTIDARDLVKRVKSVFPMVQSDDHRAVNGYSLRSIAERTDLPAIKEAHFGYISVFEGTEYIGLEGYKAVFIGFKELPPSFEYYFKDYIVVEE